MKVFVKSIVLILLLSGTIHAQQSTEPRPLVIKSNQAGAEVFLRDNLVGMTDRNGDFGLFVEPGRYPIKLTKRGFSSVFDTLVVDSVEVVSKYYPMQQVGGVLTVVVSPFDANLRFNEIPVEPNNPVLLDSGSIRIHASKPGFEPDSLIIVLGHGDTLTFDIRLQPHVGGLQLIPTPLQSTWSLIDSTGAVYLSGSGMTRKNDIQTGMYTLRVEHPGLATIEQALRIMRGMTTSLSVELPDQDAIDRGVMKDGARTAPYQLTWEGDIQRTPLQQPLPRFDVDVETVTSIRFEVRADGTVGRIQPLQRIDPNLERVVLNTLRSWRFSRLPSSVPQESQWGRITFRFYP